MFKVYVLRSLKDGRTYTGYTSNLDRRFLEHNSGKVNATRKSLPFEVMFFEEVSNLEEAKKLELYWKSGGGRRRLKKFFGGNSRST